MNTNPTNFNVTLENRLDALEAFEVFSQARNLFFWIILLMLLLTQTLFWLTDQNIIGNQPATRDNNIIDISVPAYQPMEKPEFIWVDYPVLAQQPNTPDSSTATDSPSGDTNQSPSVEPQNRTLEEKTIPQPAKKLFNKDGYHYLLKLTNYLCAISCLIYFLCLMTGLKLVIIGNLGGLADASKALFLSLILLALIMPWQKIISPEIPGVLYGWKELNESKSSVQANGDLVSMILYYTRFCGLWLISLLLAIFSQWRSVSSVKAVRQRVRQMMSYLPAMNAVSPPTITPLNTSSPMNQDDNKPIPLE